MPVRQLKIVTLLVAVIALVVGLSACSSSSESDGPTRAVQTDLGEVKVPTSPKRVVLLNHALAGYLYDLDVPVVAMTPEHTEAAGKFDDAWKAKAEAAGTEWLPWSADGFDTEAIMNFDPDLIIAGGIGFPLKHATDAYKDLSKIAPTVVVSGDLTEWQQQYEFLAEKVFDKPQVYQDAVKKYEERKAQVKGDITVPAGESAFLSMSEDRVFVLVENRGLPKEFADLGFKPAPLYATGKYKPYVAGGDSFALSTEQVGQTLTMDSLFILGFHEKLPSVDDLRKRPIFSQLPAFEKNQAYTLPYWAQRGDHYDALALLDIIDKTFKKK